MEEKLELSDTVKRAKKGESEALTELVRESKDRLYRFCLFLCGNPHLANDLVQDVFIKVIEKIATLKDPKQYQSWLFRMAKNHFLNVVRNEKRRAYEPLENVRPVASEGDSDPETVMQLEKALASLSSEERSIVLLVDLEGFSYVEAAEIIGISEPALRNRLARARKAFATKYQAERK